ncbi:MAG: LytR/AlgR family response regulator transcription factor [Bacteroidia bacterium]
MKVVIIDDERLARQELRSMLGQFPGIEILADCGDTKSALEAVHTLKPDVAFLDIQMPGKTGFELLEEFVHTPQIVFVTAHDEYAIRAFDVNALDYLLKPVQPDRLADTIRKLRERMQEMAQQTEKTDALGETDQVFVKDGERCWFVKLGDVRLFESEGNYVRLYFGTNKPLILRSLNYLDERLSQKIFFRASRKHIINLNWVENIENWFNGGMLVKLRGGEQVEISRRQAVKLKELMSL